MRILPLFVSSLPPQPTHHIAGGARAVSDDVMRAQYKNTEPNGYVVVPTSMELFTRFSKAAMDKINKLWI